MPGDKVATPKEIFDFEARVKARETARVSVAALCSSTQVKSKVAALDELTSGMSASYDRIQEDHMDDESWHTYECVMAHI